MSERQRLRVIVDGDESVPSRLSEDGKALLFECCRELLFNVTKYAGTDTATVRVREDEHCIQLVVLDRGRGFDVSQLGKLRKTGGFGLFSIRERVVALGGEVAVQSDAGTGTRIELKLPIPPSVADESRQQPTWDVEATVRRSTPGTGDRRTRVVVVDDHAIVRQGMVHILSSHEQIAVVGEAADGAAAIEAVQQHLPDVVVLDVNMPRMNGMEAAREIRRRWPEITIVALSVQSDEATARSMLEAGAVACLSKSSDSEALITTIVTRQPPSNNAR